MNIDNCVQKWNYREFSGMLLCVTPIIGTLNFFACFIYNYFYFLFLDVDIDSIPLTISDYLIPPFSVLLFIFVASLIFLFIPLLARQDKGISAKKIYCWLILMALTLLSAIYHPPILFVPLLILVLAFPITLCLLRMTLDDFDKKICSLYNVVYLFIIISLIIGVSHSNAVKNTNPSISIVNSTHNNSSYALLRNISNGALVRNGKLIQFIPADKIISINYTQK